MRLEPLVPPGSGIFSDFGIGLAIGSGLMGAPRVNALVVGHLVDPVRAVVESGRDQGLGHGRAVPAALYLQQAIRLAMNAQLVDAVVQYEVVVEQTGRHLKVFGLGCRVGVVRSQIRPDGPAPPAGSSGP